MPNNIFTKIFDDSIRQFVTQFSNMPQELFYDEENNLFHPGEYGKFREEVIRKLFRNILYEDLAVSEGFLINNNNQHSTQCDIIVYDYKHTPILKDTHKIFVPVETAVGIGEIKSTLSKADFKTALRKLAENKKLKDFAQGSIIKRSKTGDFNPKNEYCDQLFSFLICKKLDFNIENIDYNDIYEGVEYQNRHNIILSIEDGLFKYFFNFDLMSDERKRHYESYKVNTSKAAMVAHPNFLQVNCLSQWLTIDEENPLQHIREFIADLHYGIHYATILEVDIRSYYRFIPGDLFYE